MESGLFNFSFVLRAGSLGFLYVLIGLSVMGQKNIDLQKAPLRPVHVFMNRTSLKGIAALRVIKDSTVKLEDEATFVRIEGVRFKNGIIEVRVLSRLLPSAPAHARGFIGIAFRIAEGNDRFECIYIRPTNGRADQQLRRNRSTQYFSYPNYKYDRLRTEAPGMYESYADMGLNEWINLKIEVADTVAKLFINHAIQPALIVQDLKLGSDPDGAIGLFVDIGTEGYFTNLRVTSNK